MKSIIDDTRTKMTLRLFCIFVIIAFADSKPTYQKLQMTADLQQFARTFLSQVSPKRAFVQVLQLKDDPRISEMVGTMANKLLNGYASRMIADSPKVHQTETLRRSKRGLFDNLGDLGGLIDHGINVLNGNKNNSKTNSTNIDLNEIIDNLGQNLGNVISGLQNGSLLNQSSSPNGLNTDANQALINLIKQNPNLISDLESLLGVNISNSNMSLDELIDKAGDLFGNFDINTLSDLIPGIDALINQTQQQSSGSVSPIAEFNTLIHTLQVLGLNTSDAFSVLDFLEMFMNDTQLLQAFIDSLPQTYAEFKEALVIAFVEAVEEYFAKSNITIDMIEQEIYNLIGNLTNQNAQVLQALQEIVPGLLAELQSLNDTEIIEFIMSVLANEFDLMNIDYEAILQQLIYSILPNSSLNMQLIAHLQKYLPELIANLSRADTVEEALKILEPVVAYHLVLFLNLSEFAAERNLPTNTIMDVIYILLVREQVNFPLVEELMNAESLEAAWAILDPYVAERLAAIFNVPNNANSTLDVLYELLMLGLMRLPIVSDLLSNPEFAAVIGIFNSSYAETGNFTKAIIDVLDYVENNEVMINKTKEFIAWAWPSLFPQIKNDTDEKVIAGKALGSAINSVESFFSQFGITVPTEQPPTTTTVSTPRVTTNNFDDFLNGLVSQLSNDLQGNISAIIGKLPDNLVPANISFS